MLSKPENGWTTVSIGNSELRAGCMTDLPFDWLDACLNGLKYQIPMSFFIDAENCSYLIVSYYDATHIISDNGQEVMCDTYREIDFVDFARLLLKDIKLYFEDWVHWTIYEDTEEGFRRRRTELKDLIAKTDALLNRELERCRSF